MEWWMWVLIVGIVLVAVVVFVSRRPNLQQQFGTEYDRVMDDADNPRDAKHQLRGRLKQHRKLELRPLAPDAAQSYANRWFVVQSHFVDDPAAACADAGDLLDEVLRDRGYPVDEDFDTQADLVSVDHPDLVTEYRTAHEATTSGTAGDTEALRTAFVAYRNLFAELLDQQAADTDASHAAPDDGDADIDLTTADASNGADVDGADVDEASIDSSSPRARSG